MNKHISCLNNIVFFISHNEHFLFEGSSKFIMELYNNMNCDKCLLVNDNDIINTITKKSNEKSNVIIYLNTITLLPLVKHLCQYICVLVVHENNFSEYIDDLWDGNIQLFINDLSCCDKIIFVCEKTRDNYAKYINNINNDVIYNGIKVTNAKIKKTRSDILRICMVGTICVRKNQKGFIKYLSDNDLQYNVDLYGNIEPTFVNDFQNLTNYKHKGICNNMRINDMFLNYDVLISNSYNECLPYTILEAMSNEIVVISSNCGGVSEIITNEKDGYTYDIEDYQKVISILDSLDDNRTQLKIIGQNAKNKIINKFSLSKSVELHTMMCNELIKQSIKNTKHDHE